MSLTIDQWYREEPLQRGLPLMTGAFLRIAGVCKEDDIDMVISLISSSTQFDRTYIEIAEAVIPEQLRTEFRNDPWRPQNLIRGFCRENSIGYIEMLDRVQYLAKEGVLLRYPNDAHLNKRGTAEIAKILVENWPTVQPAGR